MHEMSLCEGIVAALEEQAQLQGYSQVQAVYLEIGELSSVELQAMRFAFDVVVRHSIAEGAILHIIEVPGRAQCMDCQQVISVRQRYDICPECGSYALHIIDGEQMRIKQIEVV